MNILFIGMFVPCEFRFCLAYAAVTYIFIDHMFTFLLQIAKSGLIDFNFFPPTLTDEEIKTM